MVRILAVDDEQLMLDALVLQIKRAAPDAEVISFRKSREALEYAQTHWIDAAFLDIRMKGMDGLELGRYLLNIHPEVNIIYCTSYEEHVSEAFREIRCNGYITKPVDLEAVKNELAHLRSPIKEIREVPKKRVFIQCLGYFEIFVDGKSVQFSSTKTKELLAFLVHANGCICGNQEIIAILWEDDNRHDSYYKKLRKDLILTLFHLNCLDILIQRRGSLGIDVSKVDCDFYDWKKENPGEIPFEYMTQYNWAMTPYYQ